MPFPPSHPQKAQIIDLGDEFFGEGAIRGLERGKIHGRGGVGFTPFLQRVSDLIPSHIGAVQFVGFAHAVGWYFRKLGPPQVPPCI